MTHMTNVTGSGAMAIPVYVGKTRVDVHTNIRKVTDPDPVTGEVPEDLYIYDETQYEFHEYIQLLSDELANTQLALVELYEGSGE